MASTIRNPNFWYTDPKGVDHYYDDSGVKGRTVAAPTSSSSSSSSSTKKTTTTKTTTAPKPATNPATTASPSNPNPSNPRNPNFWYTDNSGVDHYYDANGPKGRTVTATSTPATTAPKTTAPATPTTSTSTYKVQSTGSGDALAAAQARADAALKNVNPMDPTSFLPYAQAMGEVASLKAAASTSAPGTNLTPGNYIQNGQILNKDGMTVGYVDPNAKAAPVTGASLYPDNPRAAAAYDKAIQEGQSLVGKSRTAEENERLAKDSANFWVNNPLAFIEGPVNDFLTGTSVGQAVAPALQNGAGYSTSTGAHVGMGAPTGPTTPINADAVVNNAVQGSQNVVPYAPGQAPGTISGSSPPGYNTSVTANAGTTAPAPGTTSAPITATGTTPAQTGQTPVINPATGAILSGAAGVGGAIIGGMTQADAAVKAAQIQADAAKAAGQVQKDMFDQLRTDQQPWRDAGVNALGKLTSFETDNPAFGMSQFQQDPGYAFRLSEGVKALQNSAAARGGLLSGNTMKGITNYGQEAASQEYQNAFNRYTSQKGAKLNALQSLAGVGQTAVQQVGQAGQNYANNAGSALMGGANALAGGMNNAATSNASGYVGATNALTNALGGYIQNQRQDKFTNALFGGGY